MHNPTDRYGVLARAAQIIELNGLHHGDYVQDPFNRQMATPHYRRPMSVVGALNCAVSDDPRTPSNLSWQAMQLLARVVLVNGEPARSVSVEDAERHVNAWSDLVTANTASRMLRTVAGPAISQAVAS